MERETNQKGDFPVIPDASPPCVWMLAGVLTYRLCDRAYECERCALDAALRGVEPAAAGDPLESADPAPAWIIRDDRRYDAAGSWVADAGEGRMRWGLDGFAARLLDRIGSVVLPVPGTALEQGRTACWVADDGELVPLRSPLTGIVTRTNQAAQRDPGLVTSSPYDGGWLVEARCPRPHGELPGLCTPAARRASAAGQIRRLRRAALGRLGAVSAVGTTAADGGERVADLRRMLGTGRYHRLILTILR